LKSAQAAVGPHWGHNRRSWWLAGVRQGPDPAARRHGMWPKELPAEGATVPLNRCGSGSCEVLSSVGPSSLGAGR
jgi:hypothetical protein